MDDGTRRRDVIALAGACMAALAAPAAAQAPRRGPAPEPGGIPADDPRRTLVLARPDSAERPHVAIAGGTYTILLTGAETGGRFTLIDMLVPPGAGPPPHRHDFEEMFTILEGTIDFTFRGAKSTAVAGETVNIPSNAPHAFTNASDRPARLLCMCTPPGQEEFFLAVGDRVAGRTAPGPRLTAAQQAERAAKTRVLAPRYRTELLEP